MDVLLSQITWRGWGWVAAIVGSAGCGKGTAPHVVWVLGEKKEQKGSHPPLFISCSSWDDLSSLDQELNPSPWQ